MTIKLKYTDQSEDQDNMDVVITRKNLSASAIETPLAWKVIKNCGRNQYHPFELSHELKVRVSDAFGNFTPALRATEGSMFRVVTSTSGNQLVGPVPQENPRIQVLNTLSTPVNVEILQGDRLLSCKLEVPPDGSAFFSFDQTIFIGVGKDIIEGQSLTQRDMEHITTELSLEYVLSVDIVMTGQNFEYAFKLENVKTR